MLAIIGCGRMGGALLAALVERNGVTGLLAVERNAQRRGELAAQHPGLEVVDAVGPCDEAILSIKPKDAELAIGDAVAAGARRVLSVIAGVPLAKLHEWAGGHVTVVRAMPNIGALHHLSASAVTGGSMAREEDLAWAERLLEPAGTVVRVKEDQMDAVTGLSGSGPAYVFLMVEALVDAGVHAGLARPVAEQLVAQTVRGAAALLDDAAPNDLRAMVTTPAGTTAAGLRALESRAVRAALIDAVLAAADRSRELGR